MPKTAKGGLAVREGMGRGMGFKKNALPLASANFRTPRVCHVVLIARFRFAVLVIRIDNGTGACDSMRLDHELDKRVVREGNDKGGPDSRYVRAQAIVPCERPLDPSKALHATAMRPEQ